MSAKTVSVIAVIGMLCVAMVKSQATTPAAGASKGPPHPVWSKVKQFNSDIQAMRTSGTVDSAKLIADLNAIVAAAKDRAVNFTPQIQTKIQELQTSVQQMTTAGNANAQQILTMIAEVKNQVVQEIKAARATAKKN